MSRLQTLWVLLRLPVPVVFVVFVTLAAPSFVGDRVGGWLTHLGYAHGTVKFLLVVWQSLLIRQDRIVGVLALAAGAGAGMALVGLSGWRWAVVFSGFILGVLAILQPLTGWLVPVAAAVLALNLLPSGTRARWVDRHIRWAEVPGTELVAPVWVAVWVAAAMGAGPRVLRSVGAFGAVWLCGAWVVLDVFASFDAYEQGVFAPWPDDRVDPRVTTIVRAPEGVKCDFHDIDIVGDRAVAVAETTLHLLNIPLKGGDRAVWSLKPWWGPMEGLAMDSETDPASGTTWFLNGPQQIVGVQWTGEGWVEAAKSGMLPVFLHHTYMHWIPEQQRLVLFTIGTHNTRDDVLMIELETPGLQNVRISRLRLPGGERPPTIRDIAWVPPLHAFVLAPDFGTRLYLAEPGSDVVTPWMEMPTLNGRLKWIPGLNRLFIPLPNRPELWVVDPEKAVVERTIPTQPGVRTLEVDVKRGLLLTASVLTGEVRVQRLDDGTEVDRFGTLMPMVRNLAIFEEEGVALLSTWTALYRIPYAAKPEP